MCLLPCQSAVAVSWCEDTKMAESGPADIEIITWVLQWLSVFYINACAYYVGFSLQYCDEWHSQHAFLKQTDKYLNCSGFTPKMISLRCDIRLHFVIIDLLKHVFHFLIIGYAPDIYWIETQKKIYNAGGSVFLCSSYKAALMAP